MEEEERQKQLGEIREEISTEFLRFLEELRVMAIQRTLISQTIMCKVEKLEDYLEKKGNEIRGRNKEETDRTRRQNQIHDASSRS